MSVFSLSIYLLQNLVLKQRPFSVDSCYLGTTKSIIAANAPRFWAHLIEVYQGACNPYFQIPINILGDVPYRSAYSTLLEFVWVNFPSKFLMLILFLNFCVILL